MIAWLKGTIINVEGSEIVVDTYGVGYQVQLGRNFMVQRALKPGEEIELAVYTALKDDGMHLYGFETFNCRKMFVILLQVNGVGPKVALSIVDQLGVGRIVRSLRTGDDSAFTSVSGVGKKTAQRIILDLQGKADLLLFKNSEGEDIGRSDKIAAETATQAQLIADAVSALSNLGFSSREAEKTISRHTATATNISFDELIRRSLADLKKST